MERGRGIPTSWGNNKAPNNLSPPRFLCISISGLRGLTSHTLFHTSGTSDDGSINRKNEITSPLVLNLAFSLCFDQWHSSLLPLSLAFHFIHLGYEYLAYIFHMQLVDGSCPEQEHADKFSQRLLPSMAISLLRHNLWSQFYAVQFDFSSHIQMFVSRLQVQQRSLACRKSTFAPQECPPQQAHKIES